MTKVIEKLKKEVPIFHYLDYKDYLLDLYTKLKSKRRRYSYLLFSRDLGLGETNVSHLIVHGKRRITAYNAKRIANSLRLRGAERKYFFAMVIHLGTRNVKTREKAYARLMALREEAGSVVPNEEQRQLEFFSDWLHAVTFELLGLKDGPDTAETIAARILVPVTAERVQNSLDLLVNMNLIAFDAEKSRYIRTTGVFNSSTRVPGMGILRFHSKMLDLAKEALTLPADKREVSAVTLSLNAQSAARVQQMLLEMRNYLLYLSHTSEEPDRVLQVNFQIFPLMK